MSEDFDDAVRILYAFVRGLLVLAALGLVLEVLA